MQTLTSCFYRRADGTVREICYDNPVGVPGTYSIIAAPWDVPRPRNIDRPCRDRFDQPIESVRPLRRLRQSVYCGREDITSCSACRQPVTSRAAGRKEAQKEPAYRPPALSPQQVFRELVMADPMNPMAPAVRDALMDAVDRSIRAMHPVPPAPAPGASTFPRFMELPYEIRHMIWQLALPKRLLLWDDLFREGWPRGSQPGGAQPSQAVHTVNELWRSDLFRVCAEARQVVEVIEANRAVGISSTSKLSRGLDELYYPWLGTQSAMSSVLTNQRLHIAGADSDDDDSSSDEAPERASLAPVDNHWPKRLAETRLRLPAVALDAGWIDSHNSHAMAWIGGCYERPAGRRRDAASPGAAAALKRLDIVVADLLVPLGVRLELCTAAQRRLLEGGDDNGDVAAWYRGAPPPVGREFSVLVDLYDDARIDEILALQAPAPAEARLPRYGCAQHGWQNGLAGRIVSKSALHRCLGCMRAAWEARDWTAHSKQLGARLRQLCRPAILFSVILEFVDDSDHDGGGGSDSASQGYRAARK